MGSKENNNLKVKRQTLYGIGKSVMFVKSKYCFKEMGDVGIEYAAKN